MLPAAASQPDDWDEEEDGEWEAPKVPNPKCTEAGCGKWKRPTIPNPAYKGKWSADLIDNPDYKVPACLLLILIRMILQAAGQTIFVSG